MSSRRSLSRTVSSTIVIFSAPRPCPPVRGLSDDCSSNFIQYFDLAFRELPVFAGPACRDHKIDPQILQLIIRDQVTADLRYRRGAQTVRFNLLLQVASQHPGGKIITGHIPGYDDRSLAAIHDALIVGL